MIVTKISQKGYVSLSLLRSSRKSVADAASGTYSLGIFGPPEDVPRALHQTVKKVAKESKPILWPPIADELEINVPKDLVGFLRIIIMGDDNSVMSERLIVS